MILAKDRFCPICGAAGFLPIHEQRFSGLTGDLGITRYTVGTCTECGAGYANEIPSQSELDRYYADQSKYLRLSDQGADSRFDRERFRVIADQLQSGGVRREARVLDIGCATGGFLAELKRRGFQHLTGQDPSSACAACVGTWHGIEAIAGTIGEVQRTGRLFDVITMIGVLEHVREVGDVLRQVAALLVPGGVLLVAVPDVEGFEACENAPLQQFSTEHVNFFSVVSLANAGRVAGFVPSTAFHWMSQWSASICDSVVTQVFLLNGPAGGLEPDDRSGPLLAAYRDRSLRELAAVRARLRELGRESGSLLVWGAGTQARLLLQAGAFRDVEIAAFVDSNPRLQGRSLDSHAILAPSDVRARSEPILVCSQAFRDEIVSLIREQLGLQNRLLLLYPGRQA